MPALRATPSQPVGRFFSIGLAPRDMPAVALSTAGGPSALRGRVYDGAGSAVADAVVELWHPQGFGRCATDVSGGYAFAITRPRPGGGQAPHVTLLVFARGLVKPVMTRVYFPEEHERNDADPVLNGIEPGEREALTAVPDGDGLRFDVHLQGDRQTPFFAI